MVLGGIANFLPGYISFRGIILGIYIIIFGLCTFVDPLATRREQKS